jgi:hypothetical protein
MLETKSPWSPSSESSLSSSVSVSSVSSASPESLLGGGELVVGAGAGGVSVEVGAAAGGAVVAGGGVVAGGAGVVGLAWVGVGSASVVLLLVLVATVGGLVSVDVGSGPLDDEEAAEEEEDEGEEPGALVDDEVFDKSVDEEEGAEVDAELDDDEPVSSAPPRAFRTSLMKAPFPYACVASHIITPPKLSNFFEYSITLASSLDGMYPVLAAVVSAGTPTMTLTSLFFETV